MKFLVDSMLGRLAKWLRILGYDTLYFSSLDDNDLVRIARAEGRMVLTRDRMMLDLDAKHPEYGFASHKGYGTKKHLEAIRTHGPLDCHRKTFRPISELNQGELF